MTMNTPASPRRSDLHNVLLSIVLPVYNEQHVLKELVARVCESAAECGTRFEVVLVNDGSRDGSTESLDQLAAMEDRVKVVHLSRNFGHQAAVQAGLVHARGDAIVLMDSDLQDAPEAIPRFFAEWQAGYDVVYALRAKRKEGFAKRMLFAGFHRFLSTVATTDIPADAGIFGLIDARVREEIVELGERDRYLPGLRSWVGFRQKGIVVERRARYDGTPRVSVMGLFRLAKTAVFGFSSFPLFVFNMIGAAALFVFVALSGYALFCKVFTELAIPGWTSHVLSASFFGALNALGISVLGEYVIRIYDQVRERPMYLVSRTVNLSRREAASRDSLARESLSVAEPFDMAVDEAAVLHGVAFGSPSEEQLLAEANALLEAASQLNAMSQHTATSQLEAQTAHAQPGIFTPDDETE